jgi:hypothetical protein
MYVRVFSNILDSSLMDTSLEARWLFIAMLIIGDEGRDGVIDMPIKRLAERASLTVEQTRRGLEDLMAPDNESSSRAQDGRRIINLHEDQPERGWVIVNWHVYKEIAREEARKSQSRKDSAAYRERLKEIESSSGKRQVPVR